MPSALVFVDQRTSQLAYVKPSRSTTSISPSVQRALTSAPATGTPPGSTTFTVCASIGGGSGTTRVCGSVPMSTENILYTELPLAKYASPISSSMPVPGDTDG